MLSKSFCTQCFPALTIQDCQLFYKKGMASLCQDGCVIRFSKDIKDRK